MGTNENWQKIMNKYKSQNLGRANSVKLYCKFECCAGDYESWANCPITNCFLWKFRKGREISTNKKTTSENPHFKGMNEQKSISEQRGKGE